MIKFANTRNRSRVCLFPQNETAILVKKNVQNNFWTSFVLLFFALPICTVVIASRKETNITSSYNLLLSSLR